LRSWPNGGTKTEEWGVFRSAKGGLGESDGAKAVAKVAVGNVKARERHGMSLGYK